MSDVDVDAESLQNAPVSLPHPTWYDSTSSPSRCAHPFPASPFPPIPALPALHRGDVIEIQGPAASGKTHLLYHILLSLLVPVAPPADAHIAAVVYDTDLSFDIRRFRHLLLARLSDHPVTTHDPHESVRRALTRLHLFRPTSFAQLAASIANLPAYHSSHMPNQEVVFLAIDSISTFHWADRFAAEQLRGIGPDGNNSSPPAISPLWTVMNAIQAVRRSHCPLVVLTNWALSSAPSHPHAEPLYKQHLRPFPVVEDRIAELGAKASVITDHSSSPFRLTHHISLSSPTSELLPTSPFDDALLHETRHKNGFIDSRLIRCLSRSSEARDAVRFTFQITDDHILFQPQESVEPVACDSGLQGGQL